MNELTGMGWFFIVVLIMGGVTAVGMLVLPRLCDFITQFIKWRRFVKKSDFDYEDYED